MMEPETEYVEFSGAVLEGEVYLRALDVVASLRKTADFAARMAATFTEEDLADPDKFTEAVVFEAIQMMLEQEADALDVTCMDFLSSEED